MTNSPSYTDLRLLPEFPFPVRSSAGLEAHARFLAGRFEQAYRFLSTLLESAPQVGLVVLSAEDWPTYSRPSFPRYGVTYYGEGHVVTGGPDSIFWQPVVDTIAVATSNLLETLRGAYSRPDGRIDLTPHVEWWIVHDLGHAFHVQVDYWFPRVWLMEFFADLCLYTYVAAREPAYLPALETLPRLLSLLSPSVFRYHSLSDFDTHYIKMDLTNYLWYHGHFFEAAKRTYSATGSAALQGMWETFVTANVKELSDTQLANLLRQVQPEIGQMMLTWPE